MADGGRDGEQRGGVDSKTNTVLQHSTHTHRNMFSRMFMRYVLEVPELPSAISSPLVGACRLFGLYISRPGRIAGLVLLFRIEVAYIIRR
jgi:hypothetical protein